MELSQLICDNDLKGY